MAGKSTARIDALMAKKNAGTITPDELAELNKLLAAEGAAAAQAPTAPLVTPKAANPVPAPVVPTSKAPYQAMLQGEATAVPIPALQPLTEEERVAKGDAARKAALAAGKSKAEADAEALAAYMGTSAPAATPPTTGIGAMGTGKGGISDPGVSTVRLTSPSADLVPSSGAETPAAKPAEKPAEKSAVARLIDALKAEEKSTGPNVWDFIEAGAAGWQGRKPAYLEKAAAEAERKQKLEELARTAELQTELNAADNAAAMQRILAQYGGETSALKGLEGLSGVGNLSDGQKLALQYIAYLGGK